MLNETLLTGFLSDLSHQQCVVPTSNAASGLLTAWNNKSGMEQSDQLYWGLSWYKVAMCSSDVGYNERNNGRLGQMKKEGTYGKKVIKDGFRRGIRERSVVLS